MGDILQVVTRTAPLHAKADKGSEMVSELLFGETVEVISYRKDWVKAMSLRDRYTGFLHAVHLSDDILDPTFQVNALQSFIYTQPDFRTPPLTSLPFLSRIAITQEEENGFVQMEGDGWVWAEHLEDVTVRHKDLAGTALRFAGTPYLWGGRSCRGIDCSGLTQLCLQAAGLPCPRDSGDQMEAITGKDIPVKSLMRGDLVFFKGHVGIMTDSKNIINATARTMDTRVEALSEMAEHYEGGILACHRPAF